MKYMGSKNRIAKHILPIILKDRKENQYYVEPFVGGANMIDKVDGLRIGADSNKYLIALLNKMKEVCFEAPLVDEEFYLNIKNNMNKYEDWLVGFAGFQLTYGAKWFDSYRRDRTGKRDYSLEAKNNVDKQAKNIKDVLFFNCAYNELEIPDNSIIYCDPPYENTTSYKAVGKFNHQEFWQWCRDKTKEGHKVFISEYNAPDDFECIWKMEIVSSLSKDTKSKKGIEKLFIYKGEK